MPQLNFQIQAASERKRGRKGVPVYEGKEGSRLSQMVPARQGKPTSERQADEDV